MTRENEWQGNFDHIHAVYTSFLTRVRRRLVANVGANNPDPIPGLTLNVGADSLDTIEDLKKNYSNLWINYLAFTRRSGGHMAFRTAFGQAQIDQLVGWEVYRSAGEYRTAKLFSVMHHYATFSPYRVPTRPKIWCYAWYENL